MHVVLTSPNDAISFNGGNRLNQLSLDLPINGNSRTFSVTGRRVGTRLNNATVHAHRNYPNTGIAGSATLTVYDIVTYVVSVERDQDYRADTFQDDNGNGFFRCGGDPSVKAVQMYARAEIKPSGVPGNTTGVQDLRVALVQNITRISNHATVSSPAVTGWNPSVARGATVQFPASKSANQIYASKERPGRMTDASTAAGRYARYGLYVTNQCCGFRERS